MIMNRKDLNNTSNETGALYCKLRNLTCSIIEQV